MRLELTRRGDYAVRAAGTGGAFTVEDGAPTAELIRVFHRMVVRLCEGQSLDTAFERRLDVTQPEAPVLLMAPPGGLNFVDVKFYSIVQIQRVSHTPGRSAFLNGYNDLFINGRR